MQRDARIPIPRGAPSPTEHAAMLSIYRNKGKDVAEVIKYIRKRDWILSPNTLYGYKWKPSVFDAIVSAGFATQSGEKYTLVDKRLKWVDPEKTPSQSIRQAWQRGACQAVGEDHREAA